MECEYDVGVSINSTLNVSLNKYLSESSKKGNISYMSQSRLQLALN